MTIMTETKRSKYWSTLVDILDELYPKGDKGRSKAIVFLAFAEMMLLGVDIRKIFKKYKKND